MHSLASPVVFMHMAPASLITSRHQQGKRDASGQTAGEGEKEPLGSLLLLPMEGGRARQKIQIQVVAWSFTSQNRQGIGALIQAHG